MGNSGRSGVAVFVSAGQTVVVLSVRPAEPAMDWAAAARAVASAWAMVLEAAWDLESGLAYPTVSQKTPNAQRPTPITQIKRQTSNSLQPLAVNLIDARKAADEVNVLLIGEGVITG